jgi:hypothetical protein
MQLIKFLFSALAGALLMLIFIKLEKEHTYLAVVDKDNGLVARIIWKRAFPYLGLDGNLVVENFNGKKLLYQNLVRGRDAVEDIEIEFPDISIKSGNVHLTSAKNHYKGPETISVKGVRP